MKPKEACKVKKVYDTEDKAWRDSVYFFTKFASYNTPYKCISCKLYHLTSKKRRLPSNEFVRCFNEWYGSPVL